MPRVSDHELYLFREVGKKLKWHGAPQPGRKAPFMEKRKTFAKFAQLFSFCDNIHVRREMFGAFNDILENHPSNVMVALEVADSVLGDRQVPNAKQTREFSKRLSVLDTISKLNELKAEGLHIDPMIVARRNYIEEFNSRVAGVLGKTFGVKNIGAEVKAETISGVFRYYAGVGGWVKNNVLLKGSFESMVRAFFEGGQKGLRELKFSKKSTPDSIFDFLKELHQIRSKAVSAKARQGNFFSDFFDLGLQNFRAHSKTEKLNLGKMKLQAKGEARKASKSVEAIFSNPSLEPPKGFSIKRVLAALEKGNIEEIKRVCNELKSIDARNLTRKQRAFRDAVVGGLTRSINFAEIDEGLFLFRRILPTVMRLKGVPPEEQMRRLSALRRECGDESLKRFSLLFASLGRKPNMIAFNDMAGVLSGVIKATEHREQRKASPVSANITYDLNEIIRMGEFGSSKWNCLSPGPNGRGWGLVGFALDPHEFFLSYHYLGELAGFSVIHVGKKGNKFVMLIEPPYTNEEGMSGLMKNSAENFASKVAEEIRRRKIGGLLVECAWSQKIPKALEPLPAIHADKWYDVLAKDVG